MDLQVALALARELMDQHGLWTWSLRVNARRRRVLATAESGQITLSAAYVEANAEVDVRDSILHEIAHALVGPERQHDAVWQGKCREIGADPTRLKHDLVRPPGRYRATCWGCDEVIYRYRRPTAPHGYHCIKCGPAGGVLTFVDTGAGQRESMVG